MDVNNPMLLDIPEEILGPRVFLRPWRPGDGAALFHEISTCREHIGRWLPWIDQHDSVSASEWFARDSSAKWIRRESLQVGIWDRSTGALLGGSGLHLQKWEIPSFEIGYWISERHSGKGYVAESVSLLCDLAIIQLNARHLTIRCNPENVRSANVAKRLGFVHEGTERAWGRTSDGVLRDCDIYGLICTDWFSNSVPQTGC